MKIGKSHKKILTALLLVLYAFIATPVSYWHHHNANVDRIEVDNFSSTVKSNKAVDLNCDICSHYYSVAFNDVATINFIPEFFFVDYNDTYIITIITNPGYSQSNKGPPSQA